MLAYAFSMIFLCIKKRYFTSNTTFVNLLSLLHKIVDKFRNKNFVIKISIKNNYKSKCYTIILIINILQYYYYIEYTHAEK